MAVVDPNAPAAAPRKPREFLPIGPYLVEIAWAEKTLSNKGTPRVTFTFTISAGGQSGKSYREDVYLTDGSLWKIQTLARAAGVKKAFDADNNSELIDVFVGKKLKIVLGEDNWTDNAGVEQDGRKIALFESLDPETKRAMDAERKARFGDKGGAAAPASTGSTRIAPQGADESEEHEGDLPF